MKEFCLKTKSGEVINKTKANNEVLAIQYFSKIKNLEPKDLLSIYIVE